MGQAKADVFRNVECQLIYQVVDGYGLAFLRANNSLEF